MNRIANILSRAGLTAPAGRLSPNILQALQAVQGEIGYVPHESVGEVAAALDVTKAEVAGVLSFYPDLRTKPPGRHMIRICQGESCVANHCKLVLKELEKKLGVRLGETTRDGQFTLENVYCLGNCAASPTVTIDEDVFGRVTPSVIGTLLKDYR